MTRVGIPASEDLVVGFPGGCDGAVGNADAGSAIYLYTESAGAATVASADGWQLIVQ